MRRILIVEDDKLLLNVYRANFTAKGFKVDLAKDGEEAWEKIKNDNYDAILLDLRLPKLSGQQILERINKQDVPAKYKPIIVLSNIDEKETVQAVMNQGARAYLFKDKLDPQGVVSEVGKYLN